MELNTLYSNETYMDVLNYTNERSNDSNISIIRGHNIYKYNMFILFLTLQQSIDIIID